MQGKFNTLHYTRVSADICGIIYLRSGGYHVKKSAQKQLGIQAFFKPMLELALHGFTERLYAFNLLLC